MRPFAEFPQAGRARIRGVLCDIDDTLTTDGRLTASAYTALEDLQREEFVFAGDSPNDAPMFAHFPHAVGVANVRSFAGRLAAEPAYVTQAAHGAGFRELADCLLAGR